MNNYQKEQPCRFPQYNSYPNSIIHYLNPKNNYNILRISHIQNLNIRILLLLVICKKQI